MWFFVGSICWGDMISHTHYNHNSHQIRSCNIMPHPQKWSNKKLHYEQTWANGLQIKIWSRFDVKNRTDISLDQIKICTESVLTRQNVFKSVQKNYRRKSGISLVRGFYRCWSVFCLYGFKIFFQVDTDFVQIFIWSRDHFWFLKPILNRKNFKDRDPRTGQRPRKN